MPPKFKPFPEGPCPICSKPRKFMERYPNELCSTCFKGPIVDSNGNRVTFTNMHLGYGLVSKHHENGSIIEKEDPFCFLEGKPCYAQEYRFGGIVIQMMATCPICKEEKSMSQRKDAVCYKCVRDNTFVDLNGNPVYFEHADKEYQIGFCSVHKENGQLIKKEDPICFLNGIEYYAEEIDSPRIAVLVKTT